jgi:hypothetical protein
MDPRIRGDDGERAGTTMKSAMMPSGFRANGLAVAPKILVLSFMVDSLCG